MIMRPEEVARLAGFIGGSYVRGNWRVYTNLKTRGVSRTIEGKGPTPEYAIKDLMTNLSKEHV